MTATQLPFAPETIDALHDGDEVALERLLRDAFPTLSVEAAHELDTAASAAPRVVENAFLQLWHARETIETATGAEAFLHQAVHAGAVRERSRRAALHRLETAEGVHRTVRTSTPEVSVDAAWRHVEQALHPPPQDESAQAEARAARSRNATAAHLQRLAPRRRWVAPTLALAGLGLAIVAGWTLLPARGVEGEMARAFAAPNPRTITTGEAQRGTLTLDDGSRVTLGPDSRLTIPRTFGDGVRAIQLDGTATFDVAPAAAPFAVRAGGATLFAPGTRFAVRAWSADGTGAVVRVQHGRIKVRTTQEERELAAGEAIDIAPGGALRAATVRRLEESLGWVDGWFVRTDRPVRELLPELRRWYGITIIPEDTALMGRLVSLRADIDVPQDAFDAIAESSRLTVGWVGKNRVLRDR